MNWTSSWCSTSRLARWHKALRAAARSLAFALAAALALLPAVALYAEEQIDQAKSLPPEQRQAILQAVLGADSLDDPSSVIPAEAPATPATPLPVSAAPQVPSLVPGSTLLLVPRFAPDTSRAGSSASASTAALITQVQSGNPYRLDELGNLELAGLPRIALAGLTEAQASQRLSAEPNLRDLQIGVTLLPLAPNETQALRPFGYEIFENPNSTFAPPANMPVPTDYQLGPGDALRLVLVGAQNRRLVLELDRNGEVTLPPIGTMTLAGMRFDEAKELLETRVSEQMIGTRAHVTMSSLRTMRVFVLGEAKQPGSYVVNGLSTLTNALVGSGGVSRVGSLRRIQLKRDGALIGTLDLYDLLLRGDTRADVRLQPGDVIYIPPIGPTAGISGAVRRPAIYEMSTAEAASSDVATLVRLAGGFRPDADAAMAVVERIDSKRDRVVLNVDLSGAAAASFRLHSGDVVRVPTVRPTLAAGVQIQGQVHRPGAVGFRNGMRLTDALKSVDDLQPGADLRYVLIRRESGPERRIDVLSADLAAAWAAPRSAANIRLAPRDQLFVFDAGGSRAAAIAAVMRDLQQQSSSADPTRVVSIHGRVKAPGDYPLEQAMTLADLLRAGGGLDSSAYVGEAELARYRIVDGEQRELQLLTVDLRALIAGDAAADLPLLPFDRLSVREVPQWADTETIRLEGEFRFPGDYTIRRGESLDSVVSRAGGFTELAFLEGGVFTRSELQQREQRQLDLLADRMRHDMATFVLQANRSAGVGIAGSPAVQVASSGEALLAQLQSARAVGRLVIDLKQVAQTTPPGDRRILVFNGDRLYVPRITQEVTVIGEVQYPTSHVFDGSLERDDYIRMSGGTTPDAAPKRIYIVRANGAVYGASGGQWFNRASGVRIQPGDSIVVPIDAERTPSLPLWTSVSTILYNIAIAVAAINSL